MRTRNYSKKREAILEKICTTDTHPTAEWVYRALKADYPDLSLGTVYRNIGLFRDEGLIASVGTIGGQERFDRNCEPHGHFVCRDCSAVIDFDGAEDQPEAVETLEQMGFTIDRVALVAYGSCDQCRDR